MTEIEKMIEIIARDAYEGATESDLAEVFIDSVENNLRGLPDDEIREIYNEIMGDA
jgi:hypothetical protein